MMVDDSINMANDVERHNRESTSEERYDDNIKSFIDAARGDLGEPAPFNYGHKGATAFDMMFHSLNTKGGVTLATVFAYLAKSSKDDDEAHDILTAMADQFHWITT